MKGAIFSNVLDRGTPPVGFIDKLLAWALVAPDEIFAPNPSKVDIYALIRPTLGPWTGPLHRRAAMLEVMRVHAGFESSWNWTEGVDTTNRTSMRNIEGQETGAWQVSFDSTRLGKGAMMPFAMQHGIGAPETFIPAMKKNAPLAMEYYARLIRVSIAWAGPLVRREIPPELRRDAVAEFQMMLTV